MHYYLTSILLYVGVIKSVPVTRFLSLKNMWWSNKFTKFVKSINVGSDSTIV